MITGDVLDVPGATMPEKVEYLQDHDTVRQFANQEPRAYAQMTTNLLPPPCDPSADAEFIPMQADGTHAVSGSNAMCVMTVLLETGILPMQEHETRVVLDTAAGLVEAVATCLAGRGERVTLTFFPAYAEHLDATLSLVAICGGFPQPVKLGARLVAWREADVLDWLDGQQTRGI